jgi:hypothetical protein
MWQKFLSRWMQPGTFNLIHSITVSGYKLQLTLVVGAPPQLIDGEILPFKKHTHSSVVIKVLK